MNGAESRCPHCLTIFRVSAEQLHAAGGMVRCGACNHVFNAELHRSDAPAGEPGAAGDGDIGRLYIESLLRGDPEACAIPDEQPLAGDAARPLDAEPGADADAEPRTDTDTDTGADTDAEPGADADGCADDEEDAAADAGADIGADADVNADVHADEGASADTVDDVLAAAAPDSESHSDEHAPAEPPADERALPPLPPDLQLAPLPLELELVEPPVRARPAWGWILANLLALLMLLAQIAWQQRDRYLDEPRYRAWYAAACRIARCDLASPNDIRLLRSDALSVRPDPEAPGVLLVDALISNRGSFAQPLPGIELVFLDIAEQRVASRVFLPRDYLQDAPAKAALLQPGASLSAHLALMDPGSEAVNYELHLRAIATRAD